MDLYIPLLVMMLIAAVWTVMSRSVLKAAIGLSVTSAILTIVIFMLGSPLAAVFELSVCTGLITVIFVSTISLAKPLTHKEIVEMAASRIKRYWYMPVIVIVAGVLLSFTRLASDFSPLPGAAAIDVRELIWNTRQLDLFGQILVIIVGALGVVILFTERDQDER
jgi:NADH-quinone oxidoreductase subunit J